MATHLFTYGTLMFPEVWQAVVGRSFRSTPAILTGYEIFRVAGAHYPGIIAVDFSPTSGPRPPTSPAVVAGLLYSDLDAASLERLDRFEGDEYRRQSVIVTRVDGCQLDAEAYVVRNESRHLLTAEPWTAEKFTADGHLQVFISRYGGFNRLD